MSNWCNVNHLLLADWCHLWLNVNYNVRRRFVATSFFLVDGCACSRSFCGVFSVIAVNIVFVSEQNDANITGWIFLSNCFEWLRRAWKFASLRSRSLRFLKKNISRGSVATHLRCGGIFNCWLAINLLLSLSVHNLKIGYHLTKLRAKIDWQALPV